MLSRRTGIVLPAVVAMALVAFAGDSASPKRPAVPDAAAVTAEMAQVRDALNVELNAAADGGDVRGMIATLKEYARESTDLARKFALLEVGELLAIDAHRYALAMGVAAEKVLQFDVTDMPTRLRILKAVAESEQVDDLIYGIEFANAALADAVGTEDFEASRPILEGMRAMIAAYASIEKSQEAEIRKKYPQLYKTAVLQEKPKATSAKQAWDKVFRHRRRDAYEARLAEIEAAATVVEGRRAVAEAADHAKRGASAGPDVGRYLCFDQYDWEKGLPFLESDPGPLGDAARMEAKTGSAAKATDRVALADRWWRAATEVLEQEGSLPNDAAAIQSHAAELYLGALDDMPQGFEKEVARKRIAQAEVPRLLYAVEADAAQCSTAAEAVQVYTMFLARDSLPAPMRRAGEVRLQWWQQKADQQFRRFGTDWVSPKDYESRVKQADERVRHAVDLIRLGNIALAKEELDKASDLDPTSAKADYLIGLVNTLGFDNDLLAAYYFGEAARREPTNGYMLCALANTEIMLKKSEAAHRHYLQALDHLPDPFVVENLGFVLRTAAEWELDDKILRQFNQIYRRAVHDLDLSPGQATHFVFLSPFAIDLKKDGGSGAGDTRERVQIGTGTGFVVAPHLVLTNWHVVDGCTEIMIVDPKNRERQLTATVIASTENPDLALLECKGLEAPSITLADHLPLRGEDIMCLGFPGGSLLGLALKSTKGSVISQGDEGLDGGNFLHSCIINPGNSGGPIVDQAGRLVGVVVAIVKTSSIGNAYGIGIPVERVRRFLDAEIKKYEATRAATASSSKTETPSGEPASEGTETAKGSSGSTPSRPLSWAEVDAKVSPSTVFIVGKMRVGPE